MGLSNDHAHRGHYAHAHRGAQYCGCCELIDLNYSLKCLPRVDR